MDDLGENPQVIHIKFTQFFMAENTASYATLMTMGGCK